jgi:hypothetical protein
LKPSVRRRKLTAPLFRLRRNGMVAKLPLTWTFDRLTVPATFGLAPRTPPRATQASRSALISYPSQYVLTLVRLFTAEATGRETFSADPSRRLAGGPQEGGRW